MKSILKRIDDKIINSESGINFNSSTKSQDRSLNIKTSQSPKSPSTQQKMSSDLLKDSPKSLSQIKSTPYKYQTSEKSRDKYQSPSKNNYRNNNQTQSSDKISTSIFAPSSRDLANKNQINLDEENSFINEEVQQETQNKNVYQTNKNKDLFNKTNNPHIQAIIMNSPRRKNQFNFSKFGLTLEHICTRERHSRSPVIFICTKKDCQSKVKIGCVYCILDDHADHSDQKVHFQDFLNILQEKYDNYYDNIKEFQHTIKQNEEPQIFRDIAFQIDLIKENICKQLDEIKDNIFKQYHYLMIEEDLLTAEIISNQKMFSSQIQEVIQANILNLDLQQRDTCLKLYNETETLKIQQRMKEIISINDNMVQQFSLSFDRFSQNLIYQLNKILQRQEQLTIIKKQDSIDEQINSLMDRKQSIVNIQQDTKRMNEQIKNINKTIQLLKLQKSSIIFPYTLYWGQCNHIDIQCNTIAIYECCNQAFPCTQCHQNQTKDHQIFFTSPSRRYCINCLTVFQVNHPTNTSINCTKCISDSINNQL